MRKYILILIITTAVSCLNNNSSYTVMIEELQEKPTSVNDLLFINKQEGYLFASELGNPEWGSGGELTAVDTPIVFQTADGGNIWKKSLLKNEIIKNISLNGIEIYGQKPNNDLNGSSGIYKLNKALGKWQEYTKIKGVIRDFQVFNDGHGIVCLENHGGLFYTNDGRGTWQKIPELARVDRFMVRENTINLIGAPVNDAAPFSTLFLSYSLQTKKTKILHFPIGFRAYCMEEYNGDLFFLGLQKDVVKLYKSTVGKGLTLIHQFDTGTRIFPKKIHVFGEQLAILIGERESLYVTNHLYMSFDQGKNWDEKELRNPIYSGAIYFLDNPAQQVFSTWIYCGSGELQFIDGMTKH